MTPQTLRAALALAGAALLAFASAARAAAPLVYVALGDSTGVGVGASGGGGYPQRLARRIDAAGVPVQLVNLSVSGVTSEELRRDQVPRVAGLKPGLVTLSVGVNDILRGRTLAAYSKDLEILADQLGRMKVPVVVSTLPDFALASPGAGPSFERRIEAFNAALVRTAERHGFLVADVFTATHHDLAKNGAELFSADHFHPSSAGYDRWADAMWPAVERAIAPRVQARRPAPAR